MTEKAPINSGTGGKPEIERVSSGVHRIIVPDTEVVGGVKETLVSEPEKQTENLDASFSPENKNFFNKMSEGGKDLAGKVFEAANNIPGVARFLGKMEITYNQFWADKHEKKAVELKGKMDGIDLTHNILGQSKKEIEALIADFKNQNLPGTEALSLKLKEIDSQRTELLNKKDKVQTKFESRDNNRRLYISERDRVADKLIGRYETKLDPFEKNLAKLKSDNDQLDLSIAVTEIKHKQQEERLDDIEKKRTQLEEALRKSGMSEGKIKRFEAIKILGDQIVEGRKIIADEKENILKQKFEINRKIAEVDEKANPLRDKRNEFVRIKQGRPIEINVKAKQIEEDVKYDESVETTEDDFIEEDIEDNKGRLPISFLIPKWNEYLKNNPKDKKPEKVINIDDFKKATKLNDGFKLDSKDFKKVLERYYKTKGISTQKGFNEDFLDFEKKIRNEKI